MTNIIFKNMGGDEYVYENKLLCKYTYETIKNLLSKKYNIKNFDIISYSDVLINNNNFTEFEEGIHGNVFIILLN